MNPTVTNISCNGLTDGVIALSVVGENPPYSYLWLSGDTMPIRDNLSAGQYLVTVTDSIGCDSTSARTNSNSRCSDPGDL